MTDASVCDGESDPVSVHDRRLVIISGAGRSGTSTAAGSLKHLGYVVPPPELKANAANPRGYFEPTWVINFHKRLLTRASIHTMDARPWALDRVNEAVRKGNFQQQLTTWLEEAFDSGNHLVVKDPRAFWARELWLNAAAATGADPSFLTMLRHPAEVIGSRDTHYAGGMSEGERLTRLIRNLAGWINATLTNEKTSRGHRQAFLAYEDLLADWRSALSLVDDTLRLGLPRQQLSAREHQIDDFIDPGLRRVKVTWGDLRLPEQMQELAQSIWDLLAQEERAVLTIGPDVSRELDRVATEYHQQFTTAVALATDEINTRTRQAKQATRRQVTKELREEYENAGGKRGHAGTPGASSAPRGVGTVERPPSLSDRARGALRRAGRLMRTMRRGSSR